MEILWFIPTHGDGRYLGTTKGGRETNFPYLKQIAQATDELGYAGVLIPTGKSCLDPWVLASALATHTSKLNFLIAVRPGLTKPSVAARMTATLDQVSNGRLRINVVAGGDPVELAGDGLFSSHSERYEETDEFLDIWRELLAGEKVDYQGKHLEVKGGELLYPGVQHPHPPIYFGGSSDEGIAVAAKHSDVYLTWGERKEDVIKKIEKVRKAAAKEGRSVKFGIRLHVIVRETDGEAWEAANELIQYVDDEAIKKAQSVINRFDSVGQKNMANLHKGDRNNLEISPNLWAGVGLVRVGAATALVGSAETVAQRIREYQELGIETFVFSGYPHLEESYRFAELVFPLLGYHQKEGKETVAPLGEVVGNEYRPSALIKS
ncbi:FMNH2-dependent alkanesulfonate monooxygenase [Rummeliibacillus suwonensis]|uniref:FMNH2-dependent alkanesulfonate monooxygenase n=1 Tax=Rummeliibacillus suwonensis TaxID=1306154 RepID=UPI001AAF07AA|nr:FMNH2-dependent alkanesulfonate monooxygenase [Rummeliibacillus suwonensis]MBO2535407.1 FMNH2-dependent alkanesulfonate monooxygenase [Rummeliibacillus suwonensis]